MGRKRKGSPLFPPSSPRSGERREEKQASDVLGKSNSLQFSRLFPPPPLSPLNEIHRTTVVLPLSYSQCHQRRRAAGEPRPTHSSSSFFFFLQPLLFALYPAPQPRPDATSSASTCALCEALPSSVLSQPPSSLFPAK